MPHVIIKLLPGCTDEQKRRLTDAVTREVCACLDKTEGSVSVAFEEIPRDRWTEEVVKPDILAHPGRVFKSPGYKI